MTDDKRADGSMSTDSTEHDDDTEPEQRRYELAVTIWIDAESEWQAENMVDARMPLTHRVESIKIAATESGR
jgi:hypothetical protein